MGSFLSVSEAVKNWVETLAIVVGGGWAFWRFVLRRESKPALDIALTTKIIPEPGGCLLAYFDVTLTNKSTRQVSAKIRQRGQPAYKDENEDLPHSCSLLLRPVPAGSPGTQIRWFVDGDAKGPLPKGIIVTNLLDEYEYEIEGKKEFWTEPSESSHLCVGVRLEPGIYLAMAEILAPDPPKTRKTLSAHGQASQNQTQPVDQEYPEDLQRRRCPEIYC